MEDEAVEERPCEYRTSGCTFMGTSEALKIHASEAAGQHIVYNVLKTLLENVNNDERNTEEMDVLRNELRNFQEGEERLRTQINHQLQRCVHDLETVRKTGISQTEFVTSKREFQDTITQVKDVVNGVRKQFLKKCEDLENRVQTLNALSDTVSSLEEKLAQEQQRRDELKDELNENINTSFEDHNSKLMNQKKRLEEFRDDLQEISSDFRLRKWQLDAQDNAINSFYQEIKNLEESFNAMNLKQIRKTEALDRQQQETKTGLKNLITEHVNTISKNLNRHILEFRNVKTRFNDINTMNTKSFAIKDFGREFEAAASAETERYLVNEFQCLDGYKVVFLVFLDGWKLGKGSHISVYFQLLQGTRDDQLQWPFKAKVKIQCKEKLAMFDTVNDCSEEEIKKHFERFSLGRLAYGFPMFIDHREVQNYVENDTLVINVSIIPSTRDLITNSIPLIIHDE